MPSNDDALSSELASPFRKLTSAAFGYTRPQNNSQKQSKNSMRRSRPETWVFHPGLRSLEDARMTRCIGTARTWLRKINGKWGLAIRSISGDESRPKRRTM